MANLDQSLRQCTAADLPALSQSFAGTCAGGVSSIPQNWRDAPVFSVWHYSLSFIGVGEGKACAFCGSNPYRWVSVPVILVRRSAQAKTTLESGSRITAKSSRALTAGQSCAKLAPASSAWRIPSSEYVTGSSRASHCKGSGQHRHRIHHAAEQAGRPHDQPARRIAALEQQQVAGRNDSQAGKRQNRRRSESSPLPASWPGE